MSNEALLALENGTIFRGVSAGVSGSVVGEVVFNTSITGYQEILTDPSYTRQLVTLTSPNIGNAGVNQYDQESSRVAVKGLIVRNISLLDSNFRSEESLPCYLKRNQIVAIADIDTRKLTRLLRQNGLQRGCIIAGPTLDARLALEMARAFSGLDGIDLASEVSTREPYIWNQGSYSFLADQPNICNPSKLPYHVIVYDFGVKRNILRMLVDRGCNLTVVPANTPAERALSLKPDGIFLSNGPGDPSACQGAIKCIQVLLQQSIPIFGICLGHQLLALACGARTVKMKFGHHGSNHPVRDLAENRVMITAQNHSFAVEQETMPALLEATHWSLFDGSLQGIRHRKKPAFGFQGHPEASPGPQDITELFDQFLAFIAAYQQVANIEYEQIKSIDLKSPSFRAGYVDKKLSI